MAWPDAGARGFPGVTRGVGAQRPPGGAVLGGLAEAEATSGAWSGGGGCARGGGKGAGCAALVGAVGSERGHFPGGKRRDEAPSPRPRPPPRVGRGPGGPRGQLEFFRQTRREAKDRRPRASIDFLLSAANSNTRNSELVSHVTRGSLGQGTELPNCAPPAELWIPGRVASHSLSKRGRWC